MRYADLFGALPHRWWKGHDDREVDHVAQDSRKVRAGSVFVAIPGRATDGLRHVREALARGARDVVVGSGRAGAPELAGAERIIEVDDERVALAVMSRNLHGRIDETMPIVGVTGTNGKTTTCSLVAACLEASGVKTGVLGTVVYRLGDEECTAGLTTPEAPDIHDYLQRMAGAGCGACVMEVSSVALDRGRVHGMRFSAAVFTNLTRDHLDYHGDMEAYFKAKSLLFEGLAAPACAVINIDDAYGRRLASRHDAPGPGAGVRRVTYGTTPGADVGLVSLETGVAGTVVTLVEREGGRMTLRSRLVGRPNASNIAAAAATARAMGVAPDRIEEGIASVKAVPGRLESVTGSRGRQEFAVYVDYAHTDDALRGVLETVRQVTGGRLIVVFGCGGDRDRTKRPLMGEHAERLADIVYVTSDNPRSERPESIIDEIVAGMKHGGTGGGRVHVEPDRRKAIEAAIASALPGDAVVIAGKGHETYQICGDRVAHFDDREVAREALDRHLD